MLHLWLQLAGIVEDGEVAGQIAGTEEGGSAMETKLKECGLCRSRDQIISLTEGDALW